QYAARRRAALHDAFRARGDAQLSKLTPGGNEADPATGRFSESRQRTFADAWRVERWLCKTDFVRVQGYGQRASGDLQNRARLRAGEPAQMRFKESRRFGLGRRNQAEHAMLVGRNNRRSRWLDGQLSATGEAEGFQKSAEGEQNFPAIFAARI